MDWLEMTRAALLLTILGLFHCSFSLLQSNSTCQVKCNSTQSCHLLTPYCACPKGEKECSKSTLVSNTTGIPGSGLCCYCNEDGTTCMSNPEDSKHTGANDTAKLMIVFFEDCQVLNVTDTTKGRFLDLFAEAFGNWTGLNVTRRLALWDEVSCTEGEVPNCGVSADTLTSFSPGTRRTRSAEDVGRDEAQTDAGNDEIKSRVRRKIGGGRMRSSSKTKKGSGSDLDLDYNTGYGFVEVVKTCAGIAVKMNVLQGPEDELTANQTISLLKEKLINQSLNLRFSDVHQLMAEMMFYGLNNEALSMIRIPYPEDYDGPRFVPPMDVDFRPFLYSAGSLMALFLLFVMYKMIKHTIMLKYHKFTRINSNEIKTKKVGLPPLGKEKKAPPLPEKTCPNIKMSFARVPTADDERLVRKFDWTTPMYLPGILDPGRGNNTADHERLTFDEDKDGV